MDGLKKLFQVKRILAMVLAVTLAVTSAPVTAQAAPGDIPEQTEANVEDISEDISLEETEGEPGEESAAEDEDAGTVTPEISETVPAQEEAQDQQPTDDAAPETETVSEVQADTAAAPKAEIKFYIYSNDSDIKVDFDSEKQSATVKTAYNDKKENPFKGIVDDSLTAYVELTGDSEGEYDKDVLANRLAYTWLQKGSDGNYAPMGGASAPVNAGEYRLEISIDPQIIAAESKYIDFVIEKAKLYITVDANKLPKAFAGKKVSEVQDSYIEAAGVATSEDSTAEERYLQFVTAIDKSTVKVSDPLGDVLPETDVLKKGSDYLVEIAPALKAEYQANYELTPYAKNIVITELVTVELKTESDLEPGKDITYLYGKDEVKAPIAADAPADKKVTVKITVKGEKDEATGEDKELPVVLDGDQKNITGAWLDANEIELEEGKVPENAGVYYYKLTYTDPDGVYGVDPNAKDCLVKVVVEPAKLVVRPALADDKKNYQKGTSVSDLLKNVDYKLIERDDDGKYTTKEFSIPAEEKDTFWGVSYNQPDKPQYYEPVFEVQKRTTTTITYTDTTKKAETSEGSWDKTTNLDEASGETVVKEQSDKDKTVTKNVEYRVVFAGQKGLYKDGKVVESFDINKQIDVNNADKNYDVDVTKNVLEDTANVVAITVMDSTEVKIDTADIVSNIKDMTLKDGVYTKEYDEKAPFADRSEYKKAKTDNADADKVGTFTYGWYGYELVNKLDDKGEVVKDADGNPVKEPECNDIPVATPNDYTLKTLANAGEYCLKITYSDPTKTYTAKPAYLFFEIDGKLVKVVPKQDQKPKAYTGKTISAFISEITENEAIEYSIFEKDENGTDLTETLKQLDQEVNEANKNAHLYNIAWVVLKGDNTDPAKAKYTKAENWETFIEGVPYKLGAELRFRSNSNEKYNKYYLNYTNECERAETDPIQHDWCYNPLDIELGVMSDVELIVEFHPEKLDTLEADYNGEEQFKVEDLIAAGYITAAAKNDPDTALTIGSGEGQVALDFKWGGTALGEENENPVNQGAYYLTVSYPGDDKYKEGTWYSSDNFTINPRELKIQAKAALENAEIKAGLDMSNSSVRNRLIDTENLTVTGYIDADKEAFADTDGTGLVKNAPAFKNNSLQVTVKEKGEKNSYNGYLRYGKEYDAAVSVSISNAKALKDELAGNYKITAEDIAIAVGKRGNSTVEDADHNHSDDVQSTGSVVTHVRASYEDNKVTVTPASGICYFYDNNLGITPEEKFVPGNYLVFDIVAPTEFDANGRWYDGGYADAFKNFVYENSIVETGKGHVIYAFNDDGTIRVAFRVTKEDKATARNFTILWEKLDGVNYTEDYTVDMSKAQLEDDLRTAVAPKTLAFNGVNTKMTVGETQQLDVKMTKVLNSDVVFLNYKVAAGSEKYASVTPETGVVTALAKGKATIEVYPVRRNNKGEVEPITEFKKTVKTTITINDVTAPKINSVYAYDYTFDLKYTQPADGYRREIYVLEGKNKKAKDFEDLIQDVQSKGKNKLDEAFVKWFYVTPDQEINYFNYDKKTKVVSMNVGLIEPAKEYTVYVRNVSGVRQLDDDSLATASAQGTVKSFKATKVQLCGIRLDYSTADEQAKRTPKDDKVYPNGIDEIDLSKGSVQLKALGEFEMQPGNENADNGVDREWKVLPLDKRDANYETQKLTFYAVEDPTGYTKEEVAEYKLTDYKTLIGDRYYKPSSIAKIDKKGKLSLKGVGVVYIIAYDAVSKKITPASYNHTNVDDSLEVSKASYQYALRITSPITSIKAKDITLKVGSAVSVRPSITFFNGNKKLAVPANNTNISLTVKNTDNSEDIVLDANTIIAKEPNKQVTLTVCLTDDPTVETTLKVKTKPMDPVKSLKAVDVIDDSATITFTHTGNYVDEFKIDLLDNRNRLIRSHIEELYWDWDKSDTKKGVYFYRYTLTGLKRQSVYNVVVTPIFGEQTAKEAKARFTTTNIPAAGNTSVGKDEDGNLLEGGMSIRISSRGVLLGDLDELGYLTSGNSYTLDATGADSTARARKSDTLTWKSTNSKVASVKANAGTFTATLKASSVGYTYIEVTSKITKKVIARWIVRVKSVSNGGQGAYGDTEPKYNIAWDPYYDQGIEVLTEKNPVRFATPMGQYDYRWISFTAPADGSYSLTSTNATISGYYYKTDFPEEYDAGKKEEFNGGSYADLEEGETIYFKAAGTQKDSTAVITVWYAQKYGKLTASEPVSVAGLSQVTFIAPEDNYYTFYASESGKSASSNKKYISFATEESGATDGASVGLKKDEKVTLYGFSSGNYNISVKGRTYTALSSDGKVSTGSLVADDKEGSVKDKWFAFEAKAAGEYTFTVAPDKADAMEARYYTDLTKSRDDVYPNFVSATTDGKETLSITRSLNEGDKIAICVSATGEEAVTADVSVSQPQTAEVSLTAATGELTVEQSKPVWVSFKVPEAGKEYCFNYAVETGKTVNRDYYQNDVTKSASVYQDRFTSTKDDKTIYIKLMTYDTSAKVTVSVKETKADAITTAQGASFEVTSSNKQFYTFTAPATGLYGFKVTLAEASKDKDVSIGRVTEAKQGSYLYNLEEKISNDYGVQKLLAGEKLILAVTTTETDAVKGDVKVTAVPVETLEAKEYTLAANERKWFKFTPGTAGRYEITSTALVQYSATLLAAYVTGTTLAYDSNLGVGDVVYVKAVNYTDAESKLTFTITSMDAKPLPADGKLTVKAGEPATYKYTVTQTGMYKLTYTADVEGANPTVSYSGPRIASGWEIPCPTKGQIIEFTVSVEKDAVVTLNMTQIVPSTTLEATVAKEGGVQWFEYTAPATGRYTVALTDDAGKAVTSVTTVYRKEKITGSNNSFSGSTTTWIKKDEKWYFRVQNDGAADQKVKIAFTKIVASEKLEVGAEPKSVTFAEGEEKWYSLTIDEDTKYNFTVENAGLTLYKDGDMYSYTSVNAPGQRNLTKGTYLVKAVKSGAADAASKIGVKKESFLTLKEGEDLSISLTNGGTQYIKFTPSKTAYYAFRLKEIPEDVTSVSVSGYGVSLNKNNVYAVSDYKYTMAQAEEIIATLNFTPTKEGDTKSFKLSVEEVKPAELKSELSVTVAKGEMSWFTFTAPEAGYYDFAEDSKDVAVRYVFSNGDNLPTASNGTAFPARLKMSAKQKVMFCVFYNSLKEGATVQEVPASATFKVTAKQFKPAELESELSITVAKGEMSYFTFTAPEAGYYEFAEDSKDVAVRYVYSYGDNLPTASNGTAFPTRIYMNKGEKRTFGVIYNSLKEGATVEEVPASATFKVTAKKFKPAELESELSITVAKGEMSYFTFTAPKESYYEFAEDSEDVDVRYSYSNYGLPTASINGNRFPARMHMNEGETVTFAVIYGYLKEGTTEEEVPASATFNVTVNQLNVEELSLDTMKSVTFSEGETEKWYAFQPEKTGEYHWSFSGASEGHIVLNFLENGYSYDEKVNFGSDENEISRDMYNYYNYIIRISSTDPISFNMQVTWEPPVDVSLAKEINVGKEETVSIDSGEYAVYEFTTPDEKNGYYTFSMKIEEDNNNYLYPHGTLYDSDLALCTKGYGYLNFKIVYYLYSGKTYYLKVVEDYGYPLQDGTLSVEYTPNVYD